MLLVASTNLFLAVSATHLATPVTLFCLLPRCFSCTNLSVSLDVDTAHSITSSSSLRYIKTVGVPSIGAIFKVWWAAEFFTFNNCFFSSHLHIIICLQSTLIASPPRAVGESTFLLIFYDTSYSWLCAPYRTTEFRPILIYLVELIITKFLRHKPATNFLFLML